MFKGVPSNNKLSFRTLTHNVNVIKYAHYLHYEKRDHARYTSAISNLALTFTSVLGSCSLSVFKMNGTRDEIVDKIRTQCCDYQLEDIPERFYMNPNLETIGRPRPKSYCPYALESCGLESSVSLSFKYRRIDE